MKFKIREILIGITFSLTICIGEEVPKYPTLAELGNPAKYELIQDGDKVVFTAEIVEMERTGPSPLTNEVLKSPRPVYQWRTVRQRGSHEPELIGIATFLDPAETSFQHDSFDAGTPWVPSITVDENYVWVLFTRNTYSAPPFILRQIKVNEPGRPVLKINKTESRDQGKTMDLEKLSEVDITPHFKDNWEDEIFMKYKGGFQIKSCSNGVLVMSAPVLLVASCVKAQLDSLLDTEFEVASSNHKLDPKIYPKPIHYKNLMKDKEVIIKYHFEKNSWSLEVPDGFAYPRKKPRLEAEE